jgi:predicted nucleotidyltransferase
MSKIIDPLILSVVLFGSHAREDHNEDSDYDICVFIKDEKKQKISESAILKYVGIAEGPLVNFNIYTDSVFNLMLKYGSLFLWHLKLEGKVLYGKDYFDSKVSGLKKFERHREELMYYRTLLYDLCDSRKKISDITEFDFALLFTLLRNTCMILTQKHKAPSFGRMESFIKAKELFPDIPLKYWDYECLSKYKITYERTTIAHSSPSMKPLKIEYYTRLANNLLDFALEHTK